MPKSTKTVATYTPAEIKEMWPAARARWIIKLMSSKTEPLSYTEAVKWSRRYMKRDNEWFEAA